MGLTNYSNGISSFGIPVFGTTAPFTAGPITGNVWFVNTSTGIDTLSGGGGNSPSAPLKTLSYAITQATASNGDIIYILPGSTVTISDATSTAFNKAGITIVGLGYGNQRPLFNYTTANTATIPVTAQGITVQNVRHAANFLSIAAAYTIAAGIHFACDNCLFTDASSVLNFLNIIKSTGIANTADGLTMTNNTWRGLGTTSVNSFILSANDIDRALWVGNTVILARTATAAVFATITAGVLTNLQCAYNTAISQQTADTGGGFINVGGTTSTGVVANNYLGDLSTTDLFVTTTVGLRFFNNYKTGVVGASGYLLPVADS